MYPNIGEKSLKEEVKKLKQERYKLFDRARLSKLQDLTANVLNMQRGKKGSKAVRLEHKQYREAKKQELAKIKDINEENRRIREILKELQAKREHYAFLEQKIAQLREEARAKELTIEELKKQLNEVETELKNALMTDYELKKENNALKYALKSSKMREISLKDENGSLLLELAEKNAEIEFLKEQLKEKEKIIKTITQQAKNKIIPELYVDFALKELNNEKRNNTRRVKQTNARLDVRELRSRIYQNIQSIRDRQTRDISSLLSRQSRVPKRKSSSNGKLQSIQASRRGKGRDRGSRRGRFWDNTMGLI
jgi:chromosome segregation ATPase